MKNITKREKVLLYILVCVLIFCCGLFLMIIPAMNKRTDLNTKYSSLQLELATAKASLPDYTNLEKEIKDTGKALTAIKKKYYANLKKEDVDKVLTSLTQKHNLTPTSFSIEAATQEEVLSYAEFLAAKKKKENGSSEEKNATIDSSKAVRVYNVSMTVSGSVLNLQALINEANHTKTMKIESVDYSEQATADKTMKVSFKVFII